MAAMASTSLSARSSYATPTRVTARTGVKSATRVPMLVEANITKQSRIGKQPVVVPKGVTYTLKDNHLSVKVRTLQEPVWHRQSCGESSSGLGFRSEME